MPSKKPAAKSAASAPGEMIPGAPSPTVADPTEPRVPLPPKPANNRRT